MAIKPQLLLAVGHCSPSSSHGIQQRLAIPGHDADDAAKLLIEFGVTAVHYQWPMVQIGELLRRYHNQNIIATVMFFARIIGTVVDRVVFKIASGLCVSGPCLGQRLEQIPCEIDNDAVYVTLAPPPVEEHGA